MGSRDNRPFLVPLSFHLPAMVFYKPSISAELPTLFLPLETLRAMGGAFNTTGKSGTAAVGLLARCGAEISSTTLPGSSASASARPEAGSRSGTRRRWTGRRRISAPGSRT